MISLSPRPNTSVAARPPDTWSALSTLHSERSDHRGAGTHAFHVRSHHFQRLSTTNATREAVHEILACLNSPRNDMHVLGTLALEKRDDHFIPNGG